MHKIITFILVLFTSFSLLAQEEEAYQFSLQEAIKFATDSSYNAINARRDVLAAMKQKWETTADGLPQISANVDYTYNPIIQVTPLPGEIAGGEPGTFVPVVFQPRQNMNATARLNQLIFDGSYIVALRAARTFLEYSANFEEKTKLEVRKAVVDAYGNVLLLEKSVDIISNNLANAEANLNETKKIFENGFAEEEDVEQLEITVVQLQNELRNAKRNHQITKETLNFVLGIPIETTVILTDQLNQLADVQMMSVDLVEEDLDITSTIDFKIADNLVQQRELEWQLERSKNLPTLSAFATYGYLSFSEDFNFFSNNADWFDFSAVGLSLNVPIFSSFQRNARSQRAKIALDQASTQLDENIQQIRREVNRARSDFQFATESYINSQRNLDLAERIEHKNEVKYKEGVASSFELRQAQQQLYGAQNEYLNAMLNVISAKANLETVLNKPVE
jgi:outer membrane protein TolC